MANDYFSFINGLSEHQTARGGDVNAIFAAIAAAFDKLPGPALLAGGSAGYGTSTGTASAYTLGLDPALPALTAGARVRMKVHTTSAATPTLNVSGLGAKQIRDTFNGELSVGALIAQSIVALDYDGSVWRLQNMTSPSVIAGFGIGAIGNQTPYLADFHATGLGAGLYQWGSSTLNSPETPGGGAALLTYRGDGQMHWSAWKISGTSGNNDPVEWQKGTSASSGDWGAWRRDILRGFVSGKGNYFRLRGGLQICAHSLSAPRVAVTSLGASWDFPVPFSEAPWFVGATLPASDTGNYVSCDPTDVGNTAARPAPLTGTAGISTALFFRKATTGNFDVAATINNIAVLAIGRWY